MSDSPAPFSIIKGRYNFILVLTPLSYALPRFVEWWYISTANVIYSDGQSYPNIANTLSFISVVIIAPVIEEIVSREDRWEP